MLPGLMSVGVGTAGRACANAVDDITIAATKI
jgi:hypothetical protein